MHGATITTKFQWCSKPEYSGHVNICPAFYFMFGVNFGNLSVNFDPRLIFEINKNWSILFSQ